MLPSHLFTKKYGNRWCAIWKFVPFLATCCCWSKIFKFNITWKQEDTIFMMWCAVIRTLVTREKQNSSFIWTKEERKAKKKKKEKGFCAIETFLPKLHMPSWMVCFGRAGATATNGLNINFSNRDNNRHVGTFIVGIFHRQCFFLQKENSEGLTHTPKLKAHFHTKTIMETHMPWDNAYIQTHHAIALHWNTLFHLSPFLTSFTFCDKFSFAVFRLFDVCHRLDDCTGFSKN